MPLFSYKAQDKTGAAIQGTVEAASREIAETSLKDRGFSATSIEEKAAPALFSLELPFFSRVPIKDIVIFTRQFAVLAGAKVPMVQALRTVARQTANPRFQRIVAEAASEVEAGTALSVALAAHPEAFSAFFVNIIKSGETTGKLEDVMNYLADQMERDYDLMQKIKGAMTYPIFIMVGLVIVGFVMMAFVVPKLTGTLAESGAELPWTTKLLIGVSGFFASYAVHLVVAAVAAGFGFQYWVRTPEGKRIWDRLILSAPLFGPILQRIYIVRFTRSMQTLLTGGVDIPGSLEVVADIVGNAHYRRLIIETKKEVSDGHSITTVFQRDAIVPTMVPQMMGVGEETGRLSEVLSRLTDFYSRELQNRVQNLVSAIEPLIMIVMGLAVGIMVSAIILPMFNLAAAF